MGLVVIASCLFLSRSVGLAQTTTATIVGTVVDPSGAAVPGAEVVVTSISTGIAKKATTNSAGDYEVSLLKPDQYTVRVSHPSFQTVERRGVVVHVDQRARLDFVLQLGTTRQVVEVAASAPLVSTDSSTNGQVVDTQKVTQLPLNGRNFIQLTRLAPGVSVGTATNFDMYNQGGSITVDGGRVQSSSFMLDGTDNNDRLWGGFDLNISVEAIQEFKVQNTQYSAEFGRSNGAEVNVITKSGSNQFRGDAFEFVRNDDMDSRNFFSPSVPPLKRNQFGATLGGPLTIPHVYHGTDRTFFFLDYEAQRQRAGSTLTGLTPTAAQRTGDFSSGPTITDPQTGLPFSGNVIPSSRLSQISTNILNMFYALPNASAPGYNYTSSISAPDDRDQFTARVDHQISPKGSFFGRLSYETNRNFTASLFGNWGYSNSEQMYNVSAHYTYAFSPRTINEFRFGMNIPRGHLYYYQQDGTDYITELGIQGILPLLSGDQPYVSLPTIGITGYAGVGPGISSPIYADPRIFEWADTLTTIKGKHAIKVGGDIRWNWQTNETGRYLNGSMTFSTTFTGNSLAAFLLGLPSSSTIARGDNYGDWRQKGYWAFIQDDWNVNRRLTLNLGLRYEYSVPYIETQNQLSGLLEDITGQLTPIYAGQNGVRRSIIQPDHTDFAPRIGFAFRPSGGNKTVVRGGYGIFYEQQISNRELNLRGNPPYLYTSSWSSTLAAPILTIQNPFPGGAGTNSGFSSNTAPHEPNGLVQDWSLAVERQLGANTVFKTGYVGSQGSRLTGIYYVNEANPGSGPVQPRRPDPNYGAILTEAPYARSWYHALQTSIERRYSNGLTLLAGYTWGKSLDTAASSQSDEPQNPWNIRAEKSLSQYNIANQFTLSIVYALPFGVGRPLLSQSKQLDKLVGGWQVSNITNIYTGDPFIIADAANNSGTGTTTDRPNRLCNGDLPRSQRTLAEWFDTSCFAVSAPYTFGSAGRYLFSGPGAINLDLALMKHFRLAESKTLEFRAESFDFPNHANFNTPNKTIPSSVFGTISGAANPRIMQLALKFVF
jgi:hypothetical protein